MDRTDSKIDAPVTQPRSGPVRYEVVDLWGETYGPFHNVIEAHSYANGKWPDQSQDPDRTGNGWDVQIVGGQTMDEAAADNFGLTIDDLDEDAS